MVRENDKKFQECYRTNHEMILEEIEKLNKKINNSVQVKEISDLS